LIRIWATYIAIAAILSLVNNIVLIRVQPKSANSFYQVSFYTIALSTFGYLFLALSSNVEEAILAYKIVFVAGAFLPSFLFLAMLNFCHVKLSKTIHIILITISCAIFILSSTAGFSEFFYKSVEYTNHNGLGGLNAQHALGYWLFWMQLLCYGVAYIIIIMLICVLIAFVLLERTKYGRYLYAMGGNRTAAKLSGIDVKKMRFMAGMFAALFIAIGGIVVCSRNSAAQVNGSDGYLMSSLAAVFIGRSVGGREKYNAIGTSIGALLIATLENGMTMCGVVYYILPAVKGAVLCLALIAAYASTKED